MLAECAHLERKYLQAKRSLHQLSSGSKGKGKPPNSDDDRTEPDELDDPKEARPNREAEREDEELGVELDEAEDEEDELDYSLDSPCSSMEQATRHQLGPKFNQNPQQQQQQQHLPPPQQTTENQRLLDSTRSNMSPMSHVERLKFSSSTPPSLLNQPKAFLRATSSAISAAQSQQASTRRRQLPQQPKLAGLELLRRHSGQMQPPQQAYQQPRELAAAAASFLAETSHSLRPGQLASSPIHHQQAMNILVEEPLAGSAPTGSGRLPTNTIHSQLHDSSYLSFDSPSNYTTNLYPNDKMLSLNSELDSMYLADQQPAYHRASDSAAMTMLPANQQMSGDRSEPRPGFGQPNHMLQFQVDPRRRDSSDYLSSGKQQAPEQHHQRLLLPFQPTRPSLTSSDSIALQGLAPPVSYQNIDQFDLAYGRLI